MNLINKNKHGRIVLLVSLVYVHTYSLHSFKENFEPTFSKKQGKQHACSNCTKNNITINVMNKLH